MERIIKVQGEWGVNSFRFPVLDNERVLGPDSDDHCMTLGMWWMSWNCTLKNGSDCTFNPAF